MTDKNIKQFQGEKQELTFTIQDDDGDAIDLTSADVNDVYLDLATGVKSYGEHKFQLVAANLDSNGNALFTVKSSDTENLRPGNYVYEVWVKYDNSSPYTAEVGKYFIKKRVKK